jgi:hypothetical protein
MGAAGEHDSKYIKVVSPLVGSILPGKKKRWPVYRFPRFPTNWYLFALFGLLQFPESPHINCGVSKLSQFAVKIYGNLKTVVNKVLSENPFGRQKFNFRTLKVAVCQRRYRNSPILAVRTCGFCCSVFFQKFFFKFSFLWLNFPSSFQDFIPP